MLLRPDGKETGNRNDEQLPARLLRLRSGPGRVSLVSAQEELNKLKMIRGIELPPELFAHVSEHELERCQQHVMVEAPYELRRHPAEIRLTWLAAFVYWRGRVITDDLVDLLIETIHHIGVRAERKADRKLLENFKHVANKQGILLKLATASLEHPDETVRDAIFPVVSQQTLINIVKSSWLQAATTALCAPAFAILIKAHYRRIIR